MSKAMRCVGGVAAMILTVATGPALAQAALPDPLGLRRGPLLFHGNYCGPGNRAPAPPIDALDRACMRHDSCSPDVGSGRLPACGCNRRLSLEAARVARDPRQPQDLRLTADSVAKGAMLLPCK